MLQHAVKLYKLFWTTLLTTQFIKSHSIAFDWTSTFVYIWSLITTAANCYLWSIHISKKNVTCCTLHTVSHKNGRYLYLHQILSHFQNSFTARLSNKSRIKSSLKKTHFTSCDTSLRNIYVRKLVTTWNRHCDQR